MKRISSFLAAVFLSTQVAQADQSESIEVDISSNKEIAIQLLDIVCANDNSHVAAYCAEATDIRSDFSEGWDACEETFSEFWQKVDDGFSGIWAKADAQFSKQWNEAGTDQEKRAQAIHSRNQLRSEAINLRSEDRSTVIAERNICRSEVIAVKNKRLEGAIDQSMNLETIIFHMK